MIALEVISPSSNRLQLQSVASSVPIGQKGLVHIWGRNDMDTAQQMGMSWLVVDPDGVAVESYGTWEAWPYTGAGKEHEFIGGRFLLDKPGTYRITVSLWMNYYYGKVVDWYDGPLCTVIEAPPEGYEGSITKKELEYDESRSGIPVVSVPIGQRGLVHIWGRNDTALLQDLGISWVVKDSYGAVVEEYSDWSYGHGAGYDHEFIGGSFDLDKEGTYTLEVGLFMNPDNPVVVDGYGGDLCTTTTEVPPEYELIQETTYPWVYIFQGDAETCIFEFKLTPEQIPGTEWLGERIVNVFVSELEKEGSRLLELKVYRDTTPTFWTNYRVEITATASPLAWNLIIIGVLAILFIVAIIFAIKTIDEVFFKRKALDEETKKTFSQETLTAMILDIAPETPPETLEGMSDQELRDLLNQLLGEMAPPISWLPLAILGGLGVLGVGGAAVAYAMAKPAK